jgi:peptidoglycan LD-endopeptidase CwlK
MSGENNHKALEYLTGGRPNPTTISVAAIAQILSLNKLKIVGVWVVVMVFGWSSCRPTPTEENESASRIIAVANELPAQPAQDPNMLRLVKAYPDFLATASGNEIVWKDGTRMIWDDGKEKTFEEMESNADLEDMFHYVYPKDSVIYQENYDPGRLRNDAFFKKMYGNSAQAVEGKLVDVSWPGGTVRISSVNGADKAIAAVAKDLAKPPALDKYLHPSGGGFNWRVIAGTTRLSAHSFGVAFDINVKFSHYWRWSTEFKSGKPLLYRNQIPMEVVRIFEAHGFIWGGKWYHYDTMHFEYRPELL